MLVITAAGGRANGLWALWRQVQWQGHVSELCHFHAPQGRLWIKVGLIVFTCKSCQPAEERDHLWEGIYCNASDVTMDAKIYVT